MKRFKNRSWPMFTVMALCVLESAGVAVAVPPPPGNGQRPPGREDFVPEAGYLRTAQQLFLTRRALERGGPALLAPGARLNLQGTRSLPVICLKFKNTAADPFPVANLKQRLFGLPTPPADKKTMSQYYEDMSLGAFKVTGEVIGWHQLPNNDTFYENGSNGFTGPQFGEMLEFGLKQADQSLDFAQFDNDGPDGLPNSGDDDGKVDTVFFVHPESGGECLTSNLWSHSFQYSSLEGRGSTFKTKAVRRDRNGAVMRQPNGAPIPIVVEDYTIQPALSCGGGMIEIGVFCHEFGHALGLPDFYDRTPRTGANSQGIGNWCLMGAGNNGADGDHPETPSSLGAFGKMFFGWAKVVTIADDNDPLDLEPVEKSNTIYKFPVVNSRGGLEYFLVEFRDGGPNGKSPSGVQWDEFLPKPPGAGTGPVSGLVIWHLDETVGRSSPRWPFADPDRGQNDAPSLPGSAPPSFRNPHSLISLIQADRKMDLENNRGRGDFGDLWQPGMTFQDDPACLAGSRNFDGAKTGLTLKNFKVAPALQVVVAFENAAAPAPVAVAVAAQGAAPQTEAAPPANNDQGLRNALRQLADKVSKGQANLSPKDRETLAGIASARIQALVPSPSEAQALIRAAADDRTRTIEMAGEPAGTTPIERGLAALLRKHGRTEKAQARLSPSAAAVEHIAGLNLKPIDGKTLPTEERAREWRKEIAPLVAEGAKFDAVSAIAAADSTAKVIEWPQVATVGDNSNAVVFNHEVRLHVGNDGSLKGWSAQIADPAKLKVVGSTSQLPVAEARALVSQLLGLPEDRFLSVKEGIYLIDDQPSAGRAAVQVRIDAGKDRKPIDVYIDASTKKLLSIQ